MPGIPAPLERVRGHAQLRHASAIVTCSCSASRLADASFSLSLSWSPASPEPLAMLTRREVTLERWLLVGAPAAAVE